MSNIKLTASTPGLKRKFFAIKHLFGLPLRKTYPDPVLNKDGENFEINNWLVSEFVYDQLVPFVGIHPFPLNEQVLMVSAVCWFKPTHIFEWGTHFGVSAKIFYETTKWFSIACEIHSIDLPDTIEHIEHPKKLRGKLVRNIKSVHLHEGDGISTSLALAKSINYPIRPLFFLDGDHNYQSVKRELKEVIEYNPLAPVLVHDTFYQSESSGYNISPYKAIKDVIGSRQDFRLISSNLGLPGLTLIYKKS